MTFTMIKHQSVWKMLGQIYQCWITVFVKNENFMQLKIFTLKGFDYTVYDDVNFAYQIPITNQVKVI